MQLWNRVRARILNGKGIGIHRIPSSLTSKRKKNFKEKINIPSKNICKRNWETIKVALQSKEEKQL